MWLNGHNLGRYPEKIKAPGMYLPECWLNDGENTLVVFDEEGAAIEPVKLEVETGRQPRGDFGFRAVRPGDAAGRSARKPSRVDLAAANKGNLAFKKPATASSTEAGTRPELACDGDPDTRWCAASGSAPQWWQVDLGGPHDLSGCEICWEADGRRYQYLVEGSADGRTWSVLCRPPRDARPVAGPEAAIHGPRRALRAHHRDRAAAKPGDLGQHLRGQGLGNKGRAVRGRDRPRPASLASEQVSWHSRTFATKTPSPAAQGGLSI